MQPYYSDGAVTLYRGDCRDILPVLGVVPDSCVTDPPYGETSAAWDRWPDGWVKAVGAVLPQSASLWCFGSARMFLDRRDDFTGDGWKFSQEALWVKANGSGPTNRGRLVKVHEWAYHWRRGLWRETHHEWLRDPYSGPLKGTARKSPTSVPHQGAHREHVWVDDGTRQPRSVTYVIEAHSVRYRRRHQDEKPEAVTEPLVRECTPLGGLVLDCFAGTGTVGVVARRLGRRALLVESSEWMCEIAARRLAESIS